MIYYTVVFRNKTSSSDDFSNDSTRLEFRLSQHKDGVPSKSCCRGLFLPVFDDILNSQGSEEISSRRFSWQILGDVGITTESCDFWSESSESEGKVLSLYSKRFILGSS
jgi:hypothetical protein